MTRAIAIISCLVAALLLFPVQSEYNEASEYESEAETEFCVVVNERLLSEASGNQPEQKQESFRNKPVGMAISIPCARVMRMPARILHCVFRE